MKSTWAKLWEFVWIKEEAKIMRWLGFLASPIKKELSCSATGWIFWSYQNSGLRNKLTELKNWVIQWVKQSPEALAACKNKPQRFTYASTGDVSSSKQFLWVIASEFNLSSHGFPLKGSSGCDCLVKARFWFIFRCVLFFLRWIYYMRLVSV